MRWGLIPSVGVLGSKNWGSREEGILPPHCNTESPSRVPATGLPHYHMGQFLKINLCVRACVSACVCVHIRWVCLPGELWLIPGRIDLNPSCPQQLHSNGASWVWRSGFQPLCVWGSSSAPTRVTVHSCSSDVQKQREERMRKTGRGNERHSGRSSVQLSYREGRVRTRCRGTKKSWPWGLFGEHRARVRWLPPREQGLYGPPGTQSLTRVIPDAGSHRPHWMERWVDAGVRSSKGTVRVAHSPGP